MPVWEATADGAPVDGLVDVSLDSADGTRLGRGTLTVTNTDANRGIDSGDQVIVTRDGETEFTGTLVGQPSVEGNGGFLGLDVRDNRYGLQQVDVNRPFYEMDTGKIIRRAIETRARQESAVTVHTGSSPDGWSANIPVFEVCDFQSDTYRQYGADMLFAGWRGGAAGEYAATYSGVPAGAIPGEGQVAELVTRVLVNNEGGQFRAEVALHDGTHQYVWPLGDSDSGPATGFETYRLRAEDATPRGDLITAELGGGTLRYRFEITSPLGEPRGALIDHCRTKPIAVRQRTLGGGPDLGTGGVENSGRTITRRVDSTVFELIETLGTEDQATSWVDRNDVLHYEPTGSTPAPSGLSIDYDSTAVVSAEIDRDYDDVVNEVTVQGAGDVQVAARDDASIQFYGVSPRSEPLSDPKIQTNREALARAQGFLAENAWEETAMTFEIADRRFHAIRSGQRLPVRWDPPNRRPVLGEFVVSETSTNTSGIATIGLTGHVQ
jgi:hypothetical protein